MMYLMLAFVYLIFGLLGYILYRSDSRRLFAFFVVTVVVLYALLLLLLHHDRLLERFPLWLQVWLIPLVWYLLGALIGLLGGSLAARRRLSFVIPVLIAHGGVFAYYNEPIYETIPSVDPLPLYTNQTTLYSCACAALSTALKFKGLQIGEREACRLVGTTRYGSTPAQIRYALTKLGIAYRMIDDKNTSLHPPAILFVDRRGGRENHAVTLLRRRGDLFIIFDPMEGLRRLRSNELEKIWHGRGVELL